MNKLASRTRNTAIPLVLIVLVVGTSILADSGALHRGSNNNFGVSGGNVNDRTNSFCCSGTLGSLLVDSDGVQHILSNNHVMGRSDQGSMGEDISQPGMIDLGCRVNEMVADLSARAPLGSNVDAAIAQLRAGAMDNSGAIQDIGVISNLVQAPAVGMSVAKSGRTTGFTTGSISSINASLSVQYQRNCGSGKKFTVSYTGQIVIGPGSFSAGGDSGSLIVTNDSCHRPVGLLFAGSSTTTIANPVGQVLTRIGTALGKSVSFVGNNCTAPAIAGSSDDQLLVGPSAEAIENATTAMRHREVELLSRPSIIGVGVGASDVNAGEAVIVVYVDQNSPVSTKLPKRINGVKVKRVFTDPFVAF